MMNSETNELPFQAERSFDDVVAELRSGGGQRSPKRSLLFKHLISGLLVTCGVAVVAIGFARAAHDQSLAQSTTPNAAEFIAPSPSPIITASCDATTYRDEFSNVAGNYTLLQQQTNFNAGDTVVFVNKITNTGSQDLHITLTSDFTKNKDIVQFVDSNCGANALHQNKILNCSLQTLKPNQSVVGTFRAKLVTKKSVQKNFLQTSLVSFGTMSTSCNAAFSIN